MSDHTQLERKDPNSGDNAKNGSSSQPSVPFPSASTTHFPIRSRRIDNPMPVSGQENQTQVTTPELEPRNPATTAQIREGADIHAAPSARQATLQHPNLSLSLSLRPAPAPAKDAPLSIQSSSLAATYPSTSTSTSIGTNSIEDTGTSAALPFSFHPNRNTGACSSNAGTSTGKARWRRKTVRERFYDPSNEFNSEFDMGGGGMSGGVGGRGDGDEGE